MRDISIAKRKITPGKTFFTFFFRFQRRIHQVFSDLLYRISRQRRTIMAQDVVAPHLGGRGLDLREMDAISERLAEGFIQSSSPPQGHGWWDHNDRALREYRGKAEKPLDEGVLRQVIREELRRAAKH
jgi:hypothetical protein